MLMNNIERSILHTQPRHQAPQCEEKKILDPGIGEIALLGAAALLTSILSAVVGMAGGITLLAVMLLFLPPLVVIPLHGLIQLASNSSRALIQREHLHWGVIWRYGVLLLPMGFVGLAVAQRLPPDGLKALIGVFVLIATWRPTWLMLGRHPETADPNRRFLLLGGVVGVVNIAVGATGPLIAPFFLNLGFSRFALIGTKAACQSLGHLAKTAVFGIAGFAFADYVPLLSLMILLVIAGTWIGSRILEYVDERLFVRLYMTVLTLIALRLIAEPLVGPIGLLLRGS
jgi:uncharacterized membrane protein YfcA